MAIIIGENQRKLLAVVTARKEPNNLDAQENIHSLAKVAESERRAKKSLMLKLGKVIKNLLPLPEFLAQLLTDTL